MTKKTWWATILSVVFASIMGVSQMSCLSPEEKATLAGFSTSLTAATATIAKDREQILALKAELDKYRADFMGVYNDIKAGKVPVDTGLALLDKVMLNINATQEKVTSTQKLIDENIAQAKDVQANIQAMKNKNVPWQYWLLPLGSAAAGIASMFVPGLSPLAQMLQTANGQLAATQEVAGSLSRNLDKVSAADPALASLKSSLMSQEQASDELATKALYDEIRVKARSGLI